MPLIDTGNWVSIQVEQAPPAEPQGTLDFYEIYEVSSHVHHRIIPVVLPFDLRVQGVVICQNTNTVWQLMGQTVWFVDPDGEIRALYQGSMKQVSPGATMQTSTNGVNLDKEGLWTLYAELYAEIA